MKRKKPKANRPRAAASANRESWIRGIKDAELKKLLAERAKLNPRSAPATKGGKRNGDAPAFIFMRPVCKDEDCPDAPGPDDTPPNDPCAGQNWTWQPDLAVQVNTGETNCPSAADLARIQQGLGGHLSRFRLPDPDVRVSCQGGNIFIRVWGTRVAPSSCGELARQRAQVPDLVAGGNFGVFINSSLIRRLAHEAFQAAPKTFSSNGAPSPFGPFHITGLSVGFKRPNIIETYITGYDERPWPDVHFTKTIIDRLSSLRACTTEEKNDFSVASQIIALLVLGIFSFAIPLLIPLAAFALIRDIEAATNQPDNPPQGGVGCRLLLNLPDQIPLPQTGGILPPRTVTARRAPGHDDTRPRPKRQKLVIAYAQPAVDERGLFVGALASRQDRSPSARVNGPSSLLIYSNASETFATYSVQSEDFFGTLSYSWSGGANVVIHSPNQARTKISFRRGGTQAGNSVERAVAVRVSDSEGSTVTVSRTVVVFVNEPEGLPPVCQIRPWLPQCNTSGPEPN